MNFFPNINNISGHLQPTRQLYFGYSYTCPQNQNILRVKFSHKRRAYNFINIWSYMNLLLLNLTHRRPEQKKRWRQILKIFLDKEIIFTQTFTTYMKKKLTSTKTAECNSRFCSDLSWECVESLFLPCGGYNRSRTHFTWLQTLLSSNLFSRRKPLRPSVKISNPLPSFFLTPTRSAKWLP